MLLYNRCLEWCGFLTNLGMIYALIWTLLYAISNTISKHASLNFNINKTLVFTWVMISFYWVFLISFFDSFKVDWSNYIYFFFIWLSWYLWAWSLNKAMMNLSNWIVLLIANLYVFFSYFLNNFLIGDIERFSWIKTILALTFFIIVSVFLFEKKESSSMPKLNIKALYPWLTAICWTIYSSLSNLMVKSWVFSAFQWLFYCELFIAVFSLIAFLLISLKDRKMDLTISKKQLLSYLGISFFIFVWALWFFMWFKAVWWNYVNVIGLAQIPMVSLLSYIFLKDKLSYAQIYTMISAFLILILFVIS